MGDGRSIRLWLVAGVLTYPLKTFALLFAMATKITNKDGPVAKQGRKNSLQLGLIGLVTNLQKDYNLLIHTLKDSGAQINNSCDTRKWR